MLKSKIMLEPMKVSKRGLLVTIRRETVIKNFKKGLFFLQEGVPGDNLRNKNDFKLGDVVYLKYGADLRSWTNYFLEEEDIIKIDDSIKLF